MPDTAQWLEPVTRENVTEWYRGSSGRPQYQEVEDFIIDYLNKNKRAPSVEEVAAWKSGKDTLGWTFTPESTMGRLGWSEKTMQDVLNARRYGEANYGPGMGELTPDYGLVITDALGNPVYRATGQPEISKYSEMGTYMRPPESIGRNWNMDFGGGFEAPEGTYRTNVSAPVFDYKRPGMEDIFSQSDPYKVYKARLQDFLLRRQQEDYDRIEQVYADYDTQISSLENMVNQGALSLERAKELVDEYGQKAHEKLGTLMTGENADSILSEADRIINLGLGIDRLPLFNEMGDIKGKNVMGLYEELARSDEESAKARYEADKKSYFQRNPAWANPGEYPELFSQGGATGNERGNFLGYVNSLNLPQESMSWLLNEYNNLYALWEQSGMAQPFIEWLTDYLAGG